VASDDDDAQIRARLAALEAEVKIDVDRQRARKEQALAAARSKRTAQLEEQQNLRKRQAQLMTKSSAEDEDDVVEPRHDDASDLGAMIKFAGRANRAKEELSAPLKSGEKSWVTGGLVSLFLGPVGWLYAGSWRETIPAAAGWLAIASVLSIVPVVLLMPVLMVVMPVSGIVGAMYATRFNRTGSRQRLFTPNPPSKAEKRKLKAAARDSK
jgi:hypothetical protein